MQVFIEAGFSTSAVEGLLDLGIAAFSLLLEVVDGELTVLEEEKEDDEKQKYSEVLNAWSSNHNMLTKFLKEQGKVEDIRKRCMDESTFFSP